MNLDQCKLRIAELTATISRAKATWAAGGPSTPHAERASWEAERAELILLRTKLIQERDSSRAAETAKRRASVLAILTSILQERGMQDLLDEAHDKAREAMAAGVEGQMTQRTAAAQGCR